MAYGYVRGDALIVYARPAELQAPAAPWMREAFAALSDGKSGRAPALERWAFPRDLRIGIERLLGVAGHPLELLTAQECEQRAGSAGLNEHSQDV